MLKFNTDAIKTYFNRATYAAITTILLTGCESLTQTASIEPSSIDKPTDVEQTNAEFCYNGGKAHEYTCNPDKAYKQADMRTTDVDNAWMTQKLFEVRAWLDQEKQAAINKQASPSTRQKNNYKELDEYLMTVSIDTPASQKSSSEITHILTLSQQGKHHRRLKALRS